MDTTRLIPEQLYNLDDFEQFLRQPQNQEERSELIHGVIIEKPMPTQEHGVIAARIIAHTQVFINDNAIKAYVAAEARYKMPFDANNNRMPDVSIQLTDEATVKNGAVLGMPDF